MRAHSTQDSFPSFVHGIFHPVWLYLIGEQSLMSFPCSRARCVENWLEVWWVRNDEYRDRHSVSRSVLLRHQWGTYPTEFSVRFYTLNLTFVRDFVVSPFLSGAWEACQRSVLEGDDWTCILAESCHTFNRTFKSIFGWRVLISAVRSAVPVNTRTNSIDEITTGLRCLSPV